MTGRPREAHVRRDIRECPIHGHTEFAQRCPGGHIEWRCMACANVRAKAYYAFRKTHGPMGNAKAKKEAPAQVCPDCFLVMTTEGLCPAGCSD